MNRVRDVRALGSDVGVLTGNMHTDMGTAKQLAKLLEPLQPMFIEEPLLVSTAYAIRGVRGPFQGGNNINWPSSTLV